MSKLNSVFTKVPVNVQKRSGFDLSHENLFTAKVGTLIPCSVEEVIPGDVISTGASISVELPPLATNFKGRVDARLEAFFVPNRILWAGWKDFICQGNGLNIQGSNGHVQGGTSVAVPGYTIPGYVPQLALQTSGLGPGSLSDYLGVKVSSNQTGITVNALPFLAYQKIWDDWYRDSNIQQPFFLGGIADGDAGTEGNNRCAEAPYTRKTGTYSYSTNQTWSSNSSAVGFNGYRLDSLRQRNFAKDYFTTATTRPQSGNLAELEFDLDVQGQKGSFTIASLRAANSLQKWLERNNMGGTRYYDQILAHYGVLPPDANINRPVLLGSMTSPVIVNSINQTAQIGTNAQTKNPYANSTGAQFGRGLSFNKDRLINGFEVKEHGFIMILFSLVPHAYYSSGTRRYISQEGRYYSTDYAFPEFANIGDQPIYSTEVNSLGSTQGIFGYGQRYAEYKFHDDEVHGLLADTQNLDSFVLQRSFTTGTAEGGINSAFLTIPTNYMDDVMITTSGVSGFNAIVDCYFDSKYLRVLPEYSLPSLCEGENESGKKVYVPKGGTRL